jgi:hypothetical protein
MGTECSGGGMKLKVPFAEEHGLAVAFRATSGIAATNIENGEAFSVQVWQRITDGAKPSRHGSGTKTHKDTDNLSRGTP